MRVFKQVSINILIVGIVVGSFLLMNYHNSSAPVFRAKREGVAALRYTVPHEDFDLHFVLAELKKANASITFFADDKWVKSNPEECSKIISGGHELGILGRRTNSYMTMTYEDICGDLIEAKQRIQITTGFTPVVFSPYAGDYDSMVLKAAKNAKLETVLWSVETIIDKNGNGNAASVDAMSVQNVKSGDIINLKRESLQDLDVIVEWLKSNHIHPVTVGQLLFDY